MTEPIKRTAGGVAGRSLDEELREHVRSTGVLSSQTIVEKTQEASGERQVDVAEAFAEARNTTTKAEEEPKDAGGEQINSMADILRAVQQLPQPIINLFAGHLLKIDVTPDDKNRFLASLPENRPFTKHYSIGNGAVTFTFQFRSDAASRAMWAQLVYETEQRSMTKLEYNGRMRDMLFALSVVEYNGAQFEPIAPSALAATYQADPSGQLRRTPAAWLQRAEFWAAQSPAVLTIMFKRYREFEFLYWTLTNDADAGNS